MHEYKVGETRNGYPVLPKEDRKTIFLLSDDLRTHSGIATMSKEFVLGMVHQYNIVQLAAVIKHPEEGKIVDISLDVQRETGVPDASVKLYPFSGYGNPDVVREIMVRDKVNAILHFTDPRFWGWLYQMSHEIRQNIPIVYYSIWDATGIVGKDKDNNDIFADPHWNTPFYASCDMILGISKQSHGIHTRLMNACKDVEPLTMGETNTTDKDSVYLDYVPHGINPKYYYPIREGHSEYNAL